MTIDVEETELIEQAFRENTYFKDILEGNVLDKDEDVVEVPFEEYKEQSLKLIPILIGVDELEDYAMTWFDEISKTGSIDAVYEPLLVEMGMRFSDLRNTLNSIYRLSMGCVLDGDGNLAKGVKIVGGEDE